MESMKPTFKYNYHGLQEWILVRCTAILILLYIIYLFDFIFFNNSVSYEKWYEFFNKKTTKIFSIATLYSILHHTWIGIRHILEDYIKSLFIRRIGTGIIIIILIIYLLYGIIIIWSI